MRFSHTRPVVPTGLGARGSSHAATPLPKDLSGAGAEAEAGRAKVGLTRFHVYSATKGAPVALQPGGTSNPSALASKGAPPFTHRGVDAGVPSAMAVASASAVSFEPPAPKAAVLVAVVGCGYTREYTVGRQRTAAAAAGGRGLTLGVRGASLTSMRAAAVEVGESGAGADTSTDAGTGMGADPEARAGEGRKAGGGVGADAVAGVGDACVARSNCRLTTS